MMTAHAIASRDDYLGARLELLEAEKQLTRQSDELARRRQALPWVRIDKPYRFDTEKGSRSLEELFGGRSQLVVYHFMFGPDYTAGCPSCSAIADGFDGIHVHLSNHDVAFWAVSRAPFPKLGAYRQRMGWSFPWASSFDGDFNADFGVWFSEDHRREGVVYNFRSAEPPPAPADDAEAPAEADGPVSEIAAMTGTDLATYVREAPGMSAFALEGGVVYHTYSTFARGLDVLWGAYQWLDRAPKGRNETGYWWRHHDRYGRE